MILAYDELFTYEYRLLAASRTIDNLALAVCTPRGAGIWSPSEGHRSWHEVITGSGDVCSYPLHTQITRRNRFQDYIDFDLLLKRF